MSIMQHLKDNDFSSRLSFAHWINSHNGIIDKVWFSDEAHFYPYVEVYKQNCRYWGTKKPEYMIEKPLHDERVTLCAALSFDGVMVHHFVMTTAMLLLLIKNGI
jgi:hypothetical protein